MSKKYSFFKSLVYLFQLVREILFVYSTHKIRSYSKKSVYTRMLCKKLPENEIKTVIEAGARDLRDALAIKLCYRPRIIYAFEANSHALLKCAGTLKKYWMFRDGISLIPKAVWNESRMIKFYSVRGVKLKDGSGRLDPNIGMSSCFKEVREDVVQEEIEVEAIRLDSFCAGENITEIDLLCMDIEGAEYKALVGLGEYIHKVKFIITELYFKPEKIGQATFEAVNAFLEDKGFVLLDAVSDGNPLYSNFLFARKEYAGV